MSRGGWSIAERIKFVLGGDTRQSQAKVMVLDTPFASELLADGSVTLAKLAALANQRLIGRNSSGTGVPEAVTLDQILAWAGGAWASWTPNDASGAALALTLTSRAYAKIGRTTFIRCDVTYPATADANPAIIGGLPFTVVGFANAEASSDAAVNMGPAHFVNTGTTIALFTVTGFTQVTNAQMSGKRLILSGCYEAAA